MLNLVELRPGTGTRVVLVHGFGQRAEVWKSFVDLIDPNAEVVAVDLPGHGSTDPKHDSADVNESADLLLSAGGRALYVGYSLGARVLLAALSLPTTDLLGCVLVGAKAGYLDEGDRTERVTSDNELAARIEQGGVEWFVDEWLNQPFNLRLSEAQRHRRLRLTNRATGLAASLRNAGSGRQPLVALAGTQPVTLVRGDKDLPAVMDNQARLLALLSNGKLEIVPDCGHAVPFERPEAFAAIVNEALTR